jgi:hypothetical protein
VSLDQVSVRDRTREVRPLGQILRGGFVRCEPQLKWHRVFLQNVREPFEFAVRRREEGDAIALLDHGFRFGHSDLHAAVESERRSRGDMTLVGRAQFKFSKSDLRAPFERRRELLRVQEIRRGELGGVGDLIDTLPQSFRGLLELLGLICHDDCLRGERRDVVLARLIKRHGKFGWITRQLCSRRHAIQSTIGDSRLVGTGEGPAPVPGGIIQVLKQRENADGFVVLTRAPRLAPGDKVRVVEGSFTDALGLYEGLTGKERVAILLDLLGRKVRVALDSASIDAA